MKHTVATIAVIILTVFIACMLPICIAIGLFLYVVRPNYTCEVEALNLNIRVVRSDDPPSLIFTRMGTSCRDTIKVDSRYGGDIVLWHEGDTYRIVNKHAPVTIDRYLDKNCRVSITTLSSSLAPPIRYSLSTGFIKPDDNTSITDKDNRCYSIQLSEYLRNIIIYNSVGDTVYTKYFGDYR